MSAQINELVTLAKKGDADAFGELYEFYYKDMYCYACYVTGNEDFAQKAPRRQLHPAQNPRCP